MGPQALESRAARRHDGHAVDQQHGGQGDGAGDIVRFVKGHVQQGDDAQLAQQDQRPEAGDMD
ncbi:hypothetical protein BV95_02595 [Sphingobium chlorophenolicum]|uniref:Uncharacterized protein n=1 Tax=Sphingobium chlorophenolicum TaxID=46429 RepID=A0A081RCZ8_SPHCR|nr:hypothetical protein BV95_02595 [Sphingobium chlorophenolicum]